MSSKMNALSGNRGSRDKQKPVAVLKGFTISHEDFVIDEDFDAHVHVVEISVLDGKSLSYLAHLQ